MVLILALYFGLCIFPTKQAPICRPTITEGQLGKPEIGGYVSFECEISACEGLTKIVFEKEGHSSTWIQVFEGVNKTHYQALDTSSKYSLEGRYVYYAFRNKHSLHINPLILKDHGKWRCVAYTVKQERYEASLLDFDIYVLPTDGNFAIRQNNSFLVTGQPGVFTCIADGVHPEPEVLWEVNGLENKQNATTKQREDQLWDVMCNITIPFDRVGLYTLNCVMRTKTRDRWLADYISITVQEPAIVIYPPSNSTHTIDAYSTFSLSCVGSGFNPYITWKRDGKIILTNDSRYIIKADCGTSKCEGTISSKLMDPSEACVNTENYAGSYSCFIQLEPPFTSSASSAISNVLFSEKQCTAELGQTVGLSLLALVCVALVAFVIGFLVCRKTRRGNKEPTGETEELISKNLDALARITPTYMVKDWLHMCAQFGDYDNVVLFDYGSNSVFMHDLSELIQHTVYTCDYKIHAMIRMSDDRFVVTEHGSHNIHLLQLRGQTFYRLDTIILDKGKRRTLLCLEYYNSFIKCDFSGDEALHEGTLYRIRVTDDKLKPQLLSPKNFKVSGEPFFTSLKKDKNKLVIITDCGIIYTLNLKNIRIKTDENFVDFVDGVVQSMFIDIHDNVIVGDKGGNIHVYTPNHRHSVRQHLNESVRGIAVINCRMFVCYGKLQQYIGVFKTIEGERLVTFEEELDHTPSTYTTETCFKICGQSQVYNQIFLFDLLSRRVLKYDIDKLTRPKEYTCHINIHDMIRISEDTFVAAEFDNYDIHLINLRDGKFQTQETVVQERSHTRILICTENENSFIKCEFSGDDGLHEGNIYRMIISDNKLRPQLLTKTPFTVTGDPCVMSLNSNSSKLVIVTHSGILYTGDLGNYSPNPYESLVHFIDGDVHSLNIDNHGNIMIGDRSGKIHMYTPDKQQYVVQDVNEHVRGIKVIDGDRMVVCYGRWGKQQHIKIFSFKQLHHNQAEEYFQEN